MKKLFVAYGLMAVIGAGALTGCKSEEQKEAEHMRQLECVAATGDRFCRGEGELEILEEREEHRYDYVRANVVYGPSAPGVYHNYYGDPRYGYWGNDGSYYFNDPYSVYATQTNSFLLGAGLGGLATYAITKSAWQAKNPNGWTDKTYESKDYTFNGKKVTKEQYQQRKAQSEKDRKAHKAKLNKKVKQAEKKASTAQKENAALKKQLAQANAKNKQAEINMKKATAKPTKDAQAAKKAELLAKAKARKEAKAAGKQTTGSKLKQAEQKAAQTASNNKLKQQIKDKQAAKANKPKKPTVGQKIQKSEKKASHKKPAKKPHAPKPPKKHKPAKKRK